MSQFSKTLVIHTKKRSLAAEEYRKLRTNLLYSKDNGLPQVLFVTSAVAGEGKTTTSSNIAISFAQTGRKVLLVDSDIRKPSVHQLFGISKLNGLSRLLKKQITLEEAITHIDELNMDIIPAGPSMYDPTELYSSLYFNEVYAELRKMYDVIIIDTPPVSVVTDAALISHIADACIIVAGEGSATTAELKNAKEHLERAGTHILGIVFNKVGSILSKGSYYYKYYYSDYGYGYGYGNSYGYGYGRSSSSDRHKKNAKNKKSNKKKADASVTNTADKAE